jgi:hypothetical protein
MSPTTPAESRWRWCSGSAITPAGYCLHGFRQPPQGPAAENQPTPAGAVSEEKSPEVEPYILCRDCLHPVTRVQERIAVNGAHRHTFANPHGIVFEIGCFKRASGCAAVGPASDEFTWFAGYRWRAGLCAACLTHLGWVFTAAGGDGFHGLILERLIEPS